MRTALNRALNRAATSTVKLGAQIVRSELNLKSKTVKSRTSIGRSKSGDEVVRTIRFEGKGLPLSEYRGTRQTRAGLSVKVLVRSGRKLLRGRFLYPGPFGGVSAERQRVGGKRVPRGPVELLFGPGVAQHLGKRENIDRLLAHARERFRVELEREQAFRKGTSTPGPS